MYGGGPYRPTGSMLLTDTEVVHQPAPGKPYSKPTITVNGQKLQVVDKFAYRGRTLSKAVHIGDEVTVRTAKATVAFSRWSQTLH